MSQFADYIPGDLTFPSGTTNVVIIDTDSYAGNFEREMSAYAAGAYDEDRYHGGGEFSGFDEDAEQDPRLSAIKEKIVTIKHDEYGDVSNTIWPTPNRVNNGMGGHYDEATYNGKYRCPAYESVAFFTDAPLTDEELGIVLERATKYGVERTDFNGKACPVKVIGIRQISVEVERKTSTKVRTR
jgi:hypothetical protein